MDFRSLLILVAMAACSTLAALSREDIFRIASAGIPGARRTYGNTGYRGGRNIPIYQGQLHTTSNRQYLPAPYSKYVPAVLNHNLRTDIKYIPQFPSYPPRVNNAQSYGQSQKATPPHVYSPHPYRSQRGIPPQTYSPQSYGGRVPPHQPARYHNQYQPAVYQSCTEEDPSAIYKLDADMTHYPAEEIKAELAKDEDMHATMMKMKIDRTYESYGHGIDASSCKTMLYPLASFYNHDGKHCWILPDYQEKVEFADCGHGTCDTCSKVVLRGLKPACAKNYRHVSVWSYCDEESEGDAISYIRLVIPAFCSCKHLQCY